MNEKFIRGIAFIGGGAPVSEKCRSLASHGSLVAAADSGLHIAERAGITPDWILGDMDSLDDPRRLEKYPDQRVFRYPADKDYTDTELALTFLWEQGCDEIWLIGGGGGRIDHLFALRSLFDRKRTPDRWFTDGADIYCLKEKSKLTIIHPPASIVSLFPVGEGPWKAGSHGLKWSLDGLNWNRGFFGVSNVALKGTFSVFSEEGRFLVILPYQEKDSPRV